MLYAALDQGNRLDWLSSGVDLRLAARRLRVAGAFLLQERVAAHPWVNLRFLLERNIAILIAILVALSLHHPVDQLL